MTQSHRGRRRSRGAELIEFTLVLMPMLGFTFLLLDLGWVIYKRATLQFAVREGVRFAVTNQTVKLTDVNGYSYGVLDSIKAVVQARAVGFLGRTPSDLGHAAANYATISVNYFCPKTTSTCPLTSLTAAVAAPANCLDTTPAPNQAGWIVEVTVSGFEAFPFASLLKSNTPFNFTASSADKMEGAGLGTAPTFLTCPPPS